MSQEDSFHSFMCFIGMDITGEDVPDTGLILEQGDGDIKAWPIVSSLKSIYNSNFQEVNFL